MSGSSDDHPTLDPSTMTSSAELNESKHVLVAGATGVIGSQAVQRFVADGWVVTALSRRDPGFGPEVRYAAVDLTDASACAELVASLPAVSHLVYAAVYEEDDLVRGWRSEEQMSINLQMLTNLAQPLSETGSLEHVSLFQGTKAYGVHVEPMRVPARESGPRHPHDNFYWLQEDFIKSLAGTKDFAVTIWRPQVVFGDSTGVVMNVLPVLGAYAAMEALAGRGFGWPGGPEYVLEAVDAGLIADALVWAASSENAHNETFNITNGDVFVWQNLWPMLAEAFGVSVGGDRPQRLGETMPERADEWRQLAERFGLVNSDLAALMSRSHRYADFTFATGARSAPAPALVSTIKLRKAGFDGCIDTEVMFQALIADLQEQRVLPSPEDLTDLLDRGA